MHADIQSTTLIVGTVVSLLTGLVTKWKAKPGEKAIVNAALSAASGAIAAWSTAKGHVTVTVLVSGAFNTWVVSVATYYGLWKPTGIADAVGKAAPDIGIGTAAIAPTDPVSETDDPIARADAAVKMAQLALKDAQEKYNEAVHKYGKVTRPRPTTPNTAKTRAKKPVKKAVKKRY